MAITGKDIPGRVGITVADEAEGETYRQMNLQFNLPSPSINQIILIGDYSDNHFYGTWYNSDMTVSGSFDAIVP